MFVMYNWDKSNTITQHTPFPPAPPLHPGDMFPPLAFYSYIPYRRNLSSSFNRWDPNSYYIVQGTVEAAATVSRPEINLRPPGRICASNSSDKFHIDSVIVVLQTGVDRYTVNRSQITTNQKLMTVIFWTGTTKILDTRSVNCVNFVSKCIILWRQPFGVFCRSNCPKVNQCQHQLNLNTETLT